MASEQKYEYRSRVKWLTTWQYPPPDASDPYTATLTGPPGWSRWRRYQSLPPVLEGLERLGADPEQGEQYGEYEVQRREVAEWEPMPDQGLR